MRSEVKYIIAQEWLCYSMHHSAGRNKMNEEFHN
jgi:hypothetical protein